jgi:hypothetical protein
VPTTVDKSMFECTASRGGQLPLTDDVAFFRHHGWWISPPILPERVLQAAENGFRRYRAGERDRTLPEEASYFDWHPEEGETLKQNGYLSLQISEVAELVRYPTLAATAAMLLGTAGLRLFHDRLIVKPPHVGGDLTALGWHTDRAYWRSCSSADMITAWIPFQDTTADMGSLLFMDGSHRWSGNDWMTTSHLRTLESLERQVSTDGKVVRKVAVEVRRGQVSFHHCSTVHGSEANRSSRSRVAFAVHIQPAENRHQQAFHDDGRPIVHLNDLLCRKNADGTPNYSDPDIFPSLWPAPVPALPT